MLLSEPRARVINEPRQGLVVYGAEQGIPGVAGAPGSSGGAWQFFDTVPSNAVGGDGQTAFVSSNRGVYQKIAGAWVLQGTIPASAQVSTFSFGDATPAQIATAPANKLVKKTEVYLLTPFDTVSTFTIGDTADNDRLFADTDIDLSTAGKYESNQSHSYGTSTAINLYMAPGVGNTQGNGIIFVYIQE